MVDLREDIKEFLAFGDWVNSAYGFWQMGSITRGNYKARPEYPEWVGSGKPTGKEWKAAQERKAAQELEPYERAEKFPGPFYVDEWNKPPYDLGEGFEWVKTTSDPTTGQPVREQWVSQSIQVKEVEDYTNYISAGGTLSQAQWITYGKPEAPTEEEAEAPPFPTEAPPEGYVWQLDELGRWVPVYKGEPTIYEPPTGEAPRDPYGRTATWDADNAEWRYPPDWGTDPATQRAGYIDPYQQQQLAYQQQQQAFQQQQLAQQRQQAEAELGFQREQMAWQQAESQRQYGAQLGAQPKSWLEYAAYTGEQPSIQPWMLPLMPQQYAGMVAGEPIPEWVTQPQGEGQAFSMAGLPQLTTPGRQYQARMGPTAMQQYYGYRQARTGVTPEEEQWRLWSQSPPSGQYSGLSWNR